MIDAEEPLTARARTYRRPRRAARLTNPSLKLLRPTGAECAIEHTCSPRVFTLLSTAFLLRYVVEP